MKALKLILKFLTDNMIYILIVAGISYYGVPWKDMKELLQKILSISL